MGVPPTPYRIVSEPVLELVGITKSYGPVHALRGADFMLRAGEVHALLGENGAGKSTLMKVAFGLTRADGGRMLVRGRSVFPRSPRQARELGIGMVHQHFTGIAALTVAENIALSAGWEVRPARLRARVERLMERVGLPLDPAARTADLSAALKQRLEILKALAGDSTVLLLDEPTAVLAPVEAGELLEFIKGLAAAGRSVVLITHRLEEALESADRVTVLRSGRVTLSGAASDQTPASLTTAMLGTALESATVASRTEIGDRPVRVRCVALDLLRDGGHGLAVRDANFSVAGGEILGIAAVEGNGQRELLRALAGIVRPLRGKVECDRPVSFIPEDRTTEALISELDLTWNLVLGVGRTAPWVHGWCLDWDVARQRTEALIREFGIRAPSAGVPAGALSGGNQQKLVVARALERLPRVIVAENPTRGLDVQAGRFVWERLRDAAANDVALIVYSTDLDEILTWATRVLVIAKGRIVSVAADSSRAQVGAIMLGGVAESVS
jgi:general nucleoside transport system ATP-binding protein